MGKFQRPDRYESGVTHLNCGAGVCPPHLSGRKEWVKWQQEKRVEKELWRAVL
jgi:hypothetical protein